MKGKRRRKRNPPFSSMSWRKMSCRASHGKWSAFQRDNIRDLWCLAPMEEIWWRTNSPTYVCVQNDRRLCFILSCVWRGEGPAHTAFFFLACFLAISITIQALHKGWGERGFILTNVLRAFIYSFFWIVKGLLIKKKSRKNNGARETSHREPSDDLSSCFLLLCYQTFLSCCFPPMLSVSSTNLRSLARRFYCPCHSANQVHGWWRNPRRELPYPEERHFNPSTLL